MESRIEKPEALRIKNKQHVLDTGAVLLAKCPHHKVRSHVKRVSKRLPPYAGRMTGASSTTRTPTSVSLGKRRRHLASEGLTTVLTLNTLLKNDSTSDAIAMATVAYYLLFRTNIGFKLRITGESNDVATYAGYSVVKYVLISMAFSGAMAGLAEGGGMLGVKFLYEGITAGLGYTAIIVALVGKNYPIAVIPSAFMFGVIYNGMTYLQSATSLTYTFSKSLEGLIYIFVLVTEAFNLYRIKIVRTGCVEA